MYVVATAMCAGFCAGIRLTMREAAADAWVASLRVEQQTDSILGRIPPPLPDALVRFEFARPGCWERVAVELRRGPDARIVNRVSLSRKRAAPGLPAPHHRPS